MDKHLYTTSTTARRDYGATLKCALTAFHENLCWARHVTLISAYYGRDFILTQLASASGSKRQRKVTLIFAAAATSARHEQKRELSALADDLLKVGYSKSNLNIRLATELSFLHAKLFCFTGQGGHKRYLVGSANLSNVAFSRNDEILLYHKRSHSGLDAYIAHAHAHSTSIEKVPTESPGLGNEVDFFREGYVYFRPTNQIPQSIDEFTGLPHIENYLSGRVPALTDHEPGKAGRLSLARVMREESPSDVSVSKRKRAGTSSMSVETSIGLWVPSVCVDKFEEKLNTISARRTSELADQGERFASVSRGDVETRIDAHLHALESDFGVGLRMKSEDREIIRERIERGWSRLVGALTDQRTRERLSRSLVGAPVPEFWEDERSTDEFIDSFCETLEYKMSRPLRRPAIVRVLMESFSLEPTDDPQEIRRKIRCFFENRTWSPEDWNGLGDVDEPEDDSDDGSDENEEGV